MDEAGVVVGVAGEGGPVDEFRAEEADEAQGDEGAEDGDGAAAPADADLVDLELED